MGDLFGDLFGSKTKSEVNYAPGQIEDANARGKFGTDVMMPAFQDYLKRAQTGYDQNMPGMMKAAQGLGGYAGQVGSTLGETGESAARTGIAGLSQFFDPNYGKEQFAAAINPIQSQYQTNLANQGANFGGAGQLGSARQALAGQQLAGQTQAAQMNAAADVMKDINQQRLAAGSQLGQLGQGYLKTGLDAKGTQLGAAERPMDYTTQYGKQLGLVPGGLYTPQYPGQASTETTKTDSPLSTIGTIIGKISDRTAKENIKMLGEIEGLPVYSYNYIWDTEPQQGVMAQDLLATEYAHAVLPHASGYLQVDYSQLPAQVRAFAQAL